MDAEEGEKSLIDNVHRVKRKNDIGKILYLIFLFAFYVYVIVINIRYDEPLLLYILLMSTFTFGFVFFAYKLFCFLRYSFTYYPFRLVELELLPGSFRLDHCTIQATEIDVILIDGYWNPTVGVKLKENKRIPLGSNIKIQNKRKRS